MRHADEDFEPLLAQIRPMEIVKVEVVAEEEVAAREHAAASMENDAAATPVQVAAKLVYLKVVQLSHVSSGD